MGTYKCETNETWYNNTVFARFRSTRTGNDYKRNFGASGLIRGEITSTTSRIYQLNHISEKTLNPGACPLLLRLYDKGCVAIYKEKHLRRILFMGLFKPC